MTDDLTFFSVGTFSQQVLKLELKEIREQQDLLFRFMNFLKQEGAVHVLQFCLAVGKCSQVTFLCSLFKLLKIGLDNLRSPNCHVEKSRLVTNYSSLNLRLG